MKYAELLARSDAPAGSSWGLFGPSDDIGTLNFIGSEQVLRAAACVRRGVRFNLDYPVNAFATPPLVPARPEAFHHITSRHRDQRDGYLDRFWLAGTSQLDGLRHRRHSVFGFYNGARDAEIREDSARLGVNRWAEIGIVSRGIVIDIDHWLRVQGRALDHTQPEPISVDDLDRALLDQGGTIEPGDIVMLRTGWCGYYFSQDAEHRSVLSGHAPGLEQSRKTLAWLWDHQVSMIAADNIAVEVLPPVATSPFRSDTDGLLMHPEMLGLLGLALGELWALDDLAADCRSDGVFECMLVSKPLNLIGGVGSPANAVAIK